MKALTVFLLVISLIAQAEAQTLVEDIFGRPLNQRGIVLVDWDGYLANPLITFYVKPPVGAALPGSVALSADGPRLYFESPVTVTTGGPRKTITLQDSGSVAAVRMSIFPDRDGLDEDYTLTLVFTGANNSKQTNTIPIHVIDQDLQQTNAFNVTVNFDRDMTGFFANPTARSLAIQAAADWSYFFGDMNLDAVPAGVESTYIWSNNFDGGYYFANTNAYRGYQLYAYGTTNATHRSGGEGNFNGGPQRSGGAPLAIHRSGGFEAEIYGNYNTLSWLFLTNDNQWLTTGNLGDETNDFYSIAHHEIGHALIFNVAHPGFAAAKDAGGFSSAEVVDYHGAEAPIDQFDHLDGVIDPESGQGDFGYEYYGSIPRKRWIMTKLDLLCAQEVGYSLRPTSAFAPLEFADGVLPDAVPGVPYTNRFTAAGGIPFYDWEIVDGALPPGMELDSFSGVLSGTPTLAGNYTFTVRVLDYHQAGAGVSREFALSVTVPSPPLLSISLNDAGAGAQVNLSVNGTAGQKQVIQVSSNLSDWSPLATNAAGLKVYQYIEANPQLFNQRFYRAVVQ